jgi:hypothetical protein
MKTREQLVSELKIASKALTLARQALDAFESSIEAHTYIDIESAVYSVEDFLREAAHKDCEGSYNCGSDKYYQEFRVGDVTYLGTLSVEYNRHDKKYYYVDDSEFKYEVKQ